MCARLPLSPFSQLHWAHPISSCLLEFEYGSFASKNIHVPKENACTAGSWHFSVGTLNADLDSAIFAYDYCAGPAYVMTFDHPHVRNFHLPHPRMSYGCHGINLHNMIWAQQF